MTTSASATAAAPVSKTLAPLSSAAAFNAGTGSNALTVRPAATRLAAIGPPMLPSPRNAMFMPRPFLRRADTGGFGPTDDHTHDFIGSLEDSMYPQVADDLLETVLIQIPVTAVQLQCLIGDVEAGVGDVPLRHRAQLHLVGMVGVERDGGPPQERPRRLEGGGHVGELEPDGRLVEQRSAERLPVGQVADRLVERGLG